MKIRIRNKKVVFGVLALTIAFSLIAGAAVLNFYGKVETTANVKQSIVIREPGEDWVNYDTPITHTINELVSCETECYKNWIWNRACSDGVVNFEIDYLNAPAWNNSANDWDFEGFDINQFLFGETQTIRLVQKVVDWGNAPWDEFPEGMEAILTFGTCGKEFVWNIDSECSLEGYVLIYYGNYPEYWDGAEAFEIGGLSGSEDIPSMPYAEDENAQRPISEEGETGYEHQYGAKFWLVPSEAINEGTIDWSYADEFLWETDLGFYMDCDDTTPEPLEHVWNCFSLIEGGQATLLSEEVYCWITCNHVDINIMPGNEAEGTEYKYNQLLKPVTD